MELNTPSVHSLRAVLLPGANDTVTHNRLEPSGMDCTALHRLDFSCDRETCSSWSQTAPKEDSGMPSTPVLNVFGRWCIVAVCTVLGKRNVLACWPWWTRLEDVSRPDNYMLLFDSLMRSTKMGQAQFSSCIQHITASPKYKTASQTC